MKSWNPIVVAALIAISGAIAHSIEAHLSRRFP